MAAVLLIEDDAPHRRALELGLTARGFDVTAVADGRGAREAVEGIHHDVILLDLGLPDVDGIDLCRHLHVFPGAPIVVVSGDATDTRIVAALDVGADDYVVKPVNLDVLTARIGVQLRHSSSSTRVVNEQVLHIGDVRLDTAAHAVEVAGRPVELNAQQFAILSALMRNADRLVSHDALARAAGGRTRPDRNALRVAVSRLRQRLGTDPGRPLIVTEKAVGYRLISPAPTERS